MASQTTDASIDPGKQALLDKVAPAHLEEQALVTNNRDFNWVMTKFVRLLKPTHPIGGGFVLSLPGNGFIYFNGVDLARQYWGRCVGLG